MLSCHVHMLQINNYTLHLKEGHSCITLKSSMVTASEFITSASMVSSSRSIRSIFFLIAWRAASEQRAAKSAPTCPWVSFATWKQSTDYDSQGHKQALCMLWWLTRRCNGTLEDRNISVPRSTVGSGGKCHLIINRQRHCCSTSHLRSKLQLEFRWHNTER